MSRSAIRIHASFLAVTSLGWMLSACAAGDDASTDVASTESSITTAQESLASAQAAGAACFDAFATCAATAGDDKSACLEELRACLPAEPPPAGPGCTCIDGPPPPPPPPPPPCDGGACPPPPPLPPPPPCHRPPPLGDGGAPPPPPPGDAGPLPPHPRCGPPPIAHEKLGACRDRAHTELGQGAPLQTSSVAHRTCLDEAFHAHIAELCQEASVRCSGASASTEACVRVMKACASSAAAE